MDQIKIGKFIASCGKEQGITQAAIVLMISLLFFYWKRRILSLVKNACLHIFVERRCGHDTTPKVPRQVD